MSNIDNLTYGELKHIAAMFVACAPTSKAPHPFIGRYVICRCHSAGIHSGVLVSKTGDEVILKDSRRLWSWTAKDGIALSGLAQNGIKMGKVDTVNPLIALNGVIETIPTSADSESSIRAY